jgi:hypothetical protein
MTAKENVVFGVRTPAAATASGTLNHPFPFAKFRLEVLQVRAMPAVLHFRSGFRPSNAACRASRRLGVLLNVVVPSKIRQGTVVSPVLENGAATSGQRTFQPAYPLRGRHGSTKDSIVDLFADFTEIKVQHKREEQPSVEKVYARRGAGQRNYITLAKCKKKGTTFTAVPSVGNALTQR